MPSKDKVIVKLDDMTSILRAIVEMKHAENVNLDPCLVEIGRLVLNNLNSDDFACGQVSALDHLTKSTNPQEIQDDEVVTATIGQGIVDVQDIIMLVIIETIVVKRLAGLCEAASGDGANEKKVRVTTRVKVEKTSSGVAKWTGNRAVDLAWGGVWAPGHERRGWSGGHTTPADRSDGRSRTVGLVYPTINMTRESGGSGRQRRGWSCERDVERKQQMSEAANEREKGGTWVLGCLQMQKVAQESRMLMCFMLDAAKSQSENLSDKFSFRWRYLVRSSPQIVAKRVGRNIMEDDHHDG